MPSFLLAQGNPDIIWKKQHVTDRVNNLLFTPDGGTLISGGSDRLINFWRVSDGALLQTLNTEAPFVHESAIEWMSLTSDGKLLATCSYQLIQLWELPSGQMRRLTGHTDWVVAVGFSPDGSLLASSGFDATVRIWRVSDGAVVKVLPIPGVQRCVAFSPDGTLLAAASGDDNVYIYRTSDWSLVTTLRAHTEDLFTCAFSPDGKMLATGGYDDTVRLWNVADWSLKFTFSGNGGNVYGLAFTHDSTRIGYTDGEGHTIKIHRTSDGALLRTFTGDDTEHVQTVNFSKDGLLSYGRIDSTVVLARTDFSTDPPPSAPRITSPANGATFNAPANIAINASPGKTDGSVIKMEFFQNGTKLGEDGTAPFAFNWNSVAAGTYSLTVVETDNLGATRSSGPITINVANQNTAPTVTITSPKPSANFTAPAKFTIAASASAPAGVASVEFFQNGASLGQDTTSPFTKEWSSVPVGTYSLTALLMDKNGATAISAAIEITVAEAPPETVKPRVAIISPKSGARLNAPDIILSGTASDNVGVAQVLYSLNSDSFSPANGTLNWEANLTLVPGANVVQVKSVDTTGNESAVVSRTFTYVLSDSLTLEIIGSGTVTPLKHAQILEIGKTYVITAKPDRDFIFNGWTGTVNTNAAKLSFEMVPGMSLTAMFVPNPFAQTKGIYLGLVRPPDSNHEHSGFIQIKSSSSGIFSGKFSLGASRFSLKGKFNGDGSFTGQTPRSDLTMSLQLDLDSGTDQITGLISDGGFTANIVADRAVFNAKNNPAPEAGQYTILIPPDPSAANAAQGNGFGILKIDASGKTRAAGSLADGTRFSQGAGISKNATWPFHVLLYRGEGSISGLVTFKDETGSDLDGPVRWFRPPISNAKIFVDGFAIETILIGSSYSKAIGQPVLAVPERDGNVVVNLGHGDLESGLQKSATLKANNQFVVPDSNDEKLRVTVSASSGALKGSFVHPVTGRTTKHNGVVFQKQNLAEGYFLGAEQSGFVSVVPADGERPADENNSGNDNSEDEFDDLLPLPNPEPIPEQPPRKKKKGGDDD